MAACARRLTLVMFTGFGWSPAKPAFLKASSGGNSVSFPGRSIISPSVHLRHNTLLPPSFRRSIQLRNIRRLSFSLCTFSRVIRLKRTTKVSILNHPLSLSLSLFLSAPLNLAISFRIYSISFSNAYIIIFSYLLPHLSLALAAIQVSK